MKRMRHARWCACPTPNPDKTASQQVTTPGRTAVEASEVKVSYARMARKQIETNEVAGLHAD